MEKENEKAAGEQPLPLTPETTTTEPPTLGSTEFAQFAQACEEHAERITAKVRARYDLSETEAESCYNEAVIHAFKAISRGAEPKKFDAYLLTTALRGADRLRKADQERGTAEQQEEVRQRTEALEPLQRNPEEEFDAAEVKKYVREAMAKLEQENREQWEAVRLRYLEELKIEDIAEKLDVVIGTVNSRIRLGIKKLSLYLEAAGYERL